MSTFTDPFILKRPTCQAAPILISIPHCGTQIPEDIGVTMRPELVKTPQDTDWFVERLYEFAPAMGVTLIHSVYSRYVIDLNRPEEARPLYTDGRRETSLVPENTFSGESIYLGATPDQNEIERRIQRYHAPYHQKLHDEISELNQSFENVILIEGHSIRRSVPSIQSTPFPDLILGDQNGRTSAGLYSQSSLATLRQGPYQIAYNEPFQGGFITRNFGAPDRGVHALQLEMCQDLYMDENTLQWQSDRAASLTKLLAAWIGRLLKEVRHS